MELGGKNALVVCDDADLDRAVEWTLASAFSNAGQRCAAASRIVVFDAVYEAFRDRLGRGVDALDEIGPVISEASMERILARRRAARRRRGDRAAAAETRVGDRGWHVAPTVLEGVAPDAPLSCEELFGPVAALYRVGGFDEAVALVNDSPYGLTAAIHTASVHRAMRFAERVAAGVVVVNAGTHGSEPHMGFGGVKQSGTGWKEAGVEALDVYSETQYVNLVVDPALSVSAAPDRRASAPGGRRSRRASGRCRRTGAVCVGTERTVEAIRRARADPRPRRRRRRSPTRRP